MKRLCTLLTLFVYTNGLPFKIPTTFYNQEILNKVLEYGRPQSRQNPTLDPRCFSDGNAVSGEPFQKPGDCEHFFQCSNGYLHTMPCAPGTVFNPAIGVCDWPSNVPECYAPPYDYQCLDFHGQPISTGPIEKPGNCSQFYQCSNGYLYTHDCPADLVFNPSINACDYKENVPTCNDADQDGGSGTEGSGSESSGSESSGSENSGSENNGEDGSGSHETDLCVNDQGDLMTTGPFEKPGDCNYFYQCSNGQLHTLPCAEGTVFNPALEVCDWPHNVPGCDGTNPTTSTHLNSTSAATTTKTTPGRPTTTRPALPTTTRQALPTTTRPALPTTTRPALLTTTRPALPTTTRPALPTTTRPALPTTTRPALLTTTRPAPPTTARPAPPTTARPAPPTTARPAPPTTTRSALPTTTRPAPPTTARPAPPTTTRSALPTTTRPAPPTTARPAPPTTTRSALPTTTRPAPPTTTRPVHSTTTTSPITTQPVTNTNTPIPTITTVPPQITSLASSPTSPVTTRTTHQSSTTTHSMANGNCIDANGNSISTAPFEKPGDCHYFYQCSNGQLHTLPCAEGTVFNPDIRVCDWPHNVPGCGITTTETVPITTTASPFNDDCVDANSNPISGNPFEKTGDCDHFYQCSNGYRYTMPCATGTAFNPAIGVCDWPYNVPGCGATTTTVAAPPTTTVQPFDADCLDANGNPVSGNPFEKPGDCDFFYQCLNGYRHTMPCAAGTAFNPDIGVCDWLSNVPSCHSQSSSVPTCVDSNNTPISAGPFEKPGDCGYFYQCSAGVLYTLPCAAGTAFNPDLNACDWPYNVPGC